jgi:hypothetical protein
MLYYDDMAKSPIFHLTRRSYRRTLLWSALLSFLIVIAAATLGRAAHSFKAALSTKPDLALYLLLPEEGIGHSRFLKESEEGRDYLVETKSGPALVRLQRSEDGVWFVRLVERLHD